MRRTEIKATRGTRTNSDIVVERIKDKAKTDKRGIDWVSLRTRDKKINCEREKDLVGR